MNIEQLREQLAEIDEKLIELVRDRLNVASQIGALKEDDGLPTRDYAQEKIVFERARAAATAIGLPESLANDLLLPIVNASLSRQEKERVSKTGTGSGKTALVIGGGGRMGSWFVRFLDSQGYVVTILDPTASHDGFPHIDSLNDTKLDQDIIVVACSLSAANDVLEDIARIGATGLVFDIGSLKSPIRDGLRALTDAGIKATSLHPMFGPDTELLAGRHLIIIDIGCPEASAAAEALFENSMVSRVHLDLESHDRAIAYVLGLSHALNIAFIMALEESGEAAPSLRNLSSTTFENQLSVSHAVVQENPHLYFEIQRENDYGTESLTALLLAVEKLRSVVRSGDKQAFVDIMEAGCRYTNQRR